jgi:hypothetical protein
VKERKELLVLMAFRTKRSLTQYRITAIFYGYRIQLIIENYHYKEFWDSHKDRPVLHPENKQLFISIVLQINHTVRFMFKKEHSSTRLGLPVDDLITGTGI